MGVRLTLILSGKAYEAHDFESFKRLRIGRSEDCDVVIENLGVSRYACEIVNLGGSYQLRKLGKGKVLVNGAGIKSFNLNDGDAISLGKFTIAFACSDVWSGLADGRTVTGQATMANTGAARKGRESSLSRALGYLCLGERDDEGGRLLLDSAFFTFGKDPDCDVQITKWGTPRLAAIVIREDQGFRLMDLSPKGDAVKLNGDSCTDARLNHSDAFSVRGQQVRFFSGHPGGAA